MSQTRCFIIGMCVGLMILVAWFGNQPQVETKPVVNTSTRVVIPAEMQEMFDTLCDESDDDEWYYVTTFEEVHCYSV